MKDEPGILCKYENHFSRHVYNILLCCHTYCVAADHYGGMSSADVTVQNKEKTTAVGCTGICAMSNLVISVNPIFQITGINLAFTLLHLLYYIGCIRNNALFITHQRLNMDGPPTWLK